jgi:hypothetical protein
MQPFKHIARAGINWSTAVFTAAKTFLLKTDRGRWERVSREVPPWDDRNSAIGGFIPDGVSVLDVGCGAQTMRRHLKPGCKYQPCDVIQSSPDVIHCDFNSGVYPVLPTKYDYVICSGVFEYMRDPDRFLSEVRSYGRKIIFTFNPCNPKQLLVERLGNGWVNHMQENQVEQLFSAKNLAFRVLRRKDISPVWQEVIFELTPK